MKLFLFTVGLLVVEFALKCRGFFGGCTVSRLQVG